MFLCMCSLTAFRGMQRDGYRPHIIHPSRVSVGHLPFQPEHRFPRHKRGRHTATQHY